MNKNLRGAGYAFIFFALIIAALIFMPPGYLPAAQGAATATPQDTLTPTSTNTVFTAHINFDTACRLGPGEAYDMITKVEQGKDMMLMAKDKEPSEWVQLRGVGFQDCWVERRFVTSPDLAAVAIFPTPQPPTATLVPTRTLVPTKTVTPSVTNTPKVNATPVPSRTHRPGDTQAPLPSQTKISNPTNTAGPGNPSSTPRPIDTVRPSDTPRPTNTRPPVNTPRPSNTPCPTNPSGNVPPGQCR